MVSTMKDRAPPQHQVFISFRGSDVRHNFFSFLKDALIKNSVNVVTDEDAPRGKPIDENLLKLIRKSRIAVVIFSENFPESDWCLDELVEIEKRMDLKKMLDSCPIFFDVEASHVNLVTDSTFGDILLRLEHKERKKARGISKEAWEDGEERFDHWRRALSSIASRIQSIGFATRSSFQVFISFRGQDIRYKFSSFLRAALIRSGINVFIDTEDLPRGDELDSLSVKIRESRIAFVIFTNKYMESTWCLQELTQIANYMIENILLVIPIFYDMTPNELLEYDDQLVSRWGSTEERLKKWKEALTSITNLSGFMYTKYGSEAHLVEDIVDGTKRTLIEITSTEINLLF